MGILVRFLSTDLAPFGQTFLRLIIACALMGAVTIQKKQNLLLKTKSDYLVILIMGVVGYGLQIMLYTYAIYHSTIGNVVFIFSSYPIITGILAAFILKEKITKNLAIAMVLLFCVLILIFNPTQLGQYLWGNTLAFLASTCFGIYVIGSRVLLKRGYSPESITFWSVSIAMLTSAFGAIFLEHQAIHLNPFNGMLILIFGVFNFAAYYLTNKGFLTVSAGTGTMILMLEPIVGALLGLIFFKEIPTLLFIIGAVEIIIAIYITTVKIK